MNRAIPRSCMYVVGVWLSVVPLADAHAGDTTLYSFSGGSDGGNPPSGLISGGKGVAPAQQIFYGTTAEGGADGYGTVFEVTTLGSESVVYSFTGGSDGGTPGAGVMSDGIGNLYGTTEAGGSGFGVVYKVAPGGGESVIYPFGGGSDGAVPHASLIMDNSGNLYGTTETGGASDLGVVFKITPGGTETVLHSFAGADGAYPLASLIMDGSGNLYGTTSQGGTSTNCGGGCGTIFKVGPGGIESVLHSFASGDGAFPMAGLIMDKRQDLFGTTSAGGVDNDGTVFKLSSKDKLTILHSFAGGTDGAAPVSGVTERRGLLYGSTAQGGANNSGTVFTLISKGGSDTVLYSFTGGSDGALPEGGLLDIGGNLYGTTYAGGDPGCDGGNGCGVVFELTP